MKLIIFILGMLCIQTMLYGQYCKKELFERKEQDSIAVDKLRKVHQKYIFGPIEYAVEMVEKVEEEADVPEVSRSQKNRVKTFKEKLGKLNEEITDAEVRVEEINALQNLLNQRVNSGDITSVKQYNKEWKDLGLDCLIKKQTRMQSKIEKQQSKRSWKVAWFYRFYKKKDDENFDDKKHFQHVPLLRNYLNAEGDLDISSHEDAQKKLAEYRVLKDSFKIQKDSVGILKMENREKTNELDSIKKELEQARNDYDTIEEGRNALMDSLKIVRAALDIVKKEKEELKRLLLGDKEKLDSIKTSKETLEAKLAKEREILQLIKEEKEAFAKKSREEVDKFENEISSLIQEGKELGNKNKKLKEEHDNLEDKIEELKKRNETINWLSAFLAISALLLLIGLIWHYRRYKREQKKSKLKLKRANLNLERTNKKLDEANLSLENTNKKLNEANLNLERTNNKLDEANLNLENTNKKLKKKNRKLNEKSNKLLELMRELNHRTNNNLNEISSILLLQKNSTSDETLKSMLNKARNRVKTIGLIHKQLYRENTEELITINLTVYVKELLSFVLKDHPAHSDLKTSLMLDEIKMEMDLATKVGLVINELTQNSFNHAFRDIATPELSIQVTHSNNTLKIRVQNNGNGLPKNFDPEHDAGFGLKLVASLIEDGYLEYGSEDGTFFELTFPVEVDEKGVVTKISH